VCYDDAARPPPPPRVTGSAVGTGVVLTASDGNQFAAYLATPEHPAGTRAVLLPDVNGLRPFTREMALRFAETGMATLAIDYFGRTVGSQPRDDDDFDTGPYLDGIRRQTLLRDVTAAVGYLKGQGPGPVFAVGFCMGGGVALHAATTGLGLAGVIAFYAWTGELGQEPALPPEFAAAIRCPVLGLFGDAGHAIPVEVPRALDEHMTRAGVPHEVVIYPGEPHGFFEHHHMGEDGHQTAAADCWQRILRFLGQNR
jgi:carboxymethylenebutenolidase